MRKKGINTISRIAEFIYSVLGLILMIFGTIGIAYYGLNKNPISITNWLIVALIGIAFICMSKLTFIERKISIRGH